jgi:hypothetical protein
MRAFPRGPAVAGGERHGSRAGGRLGSHRHPRSGAGMPGSVVRETAVRAGTFVPPFSRDRMTWLKPSFG